MLMLMLIIARRRGRAGECMGFSSSCRIARGLAGGKAYGHGPPGNVSGGIAGNCWELGRNGFWERLYALYEVLCINRYHDDSDAAGRDGCTASGVQ